MTATRRKEPTASLAAAVSFRAFIGVQLQASMQQQMAGRLADLREQAIANGHFEPPEKLHITLKYIGLMPRNDQEKLLKGLQEAVAEIRPPSIEVAGFGCFLRRARKDNDRVSVVWAGVRDLSGELSQLADVVDQVVCNLALAKPEKLAFQPHVTLARDASNWPQLLRGSIESFGSMDVQQITLFKSEGGKYIPMGKAHLKVI